MCGTFEQLKRADLSCSDLYVQLENDKLHLSMNLLLLLISSFDYQLKIGKKIINSLTKHF